MTHKQIAKDLVNKFANVKSYKGIPLYTENAAACALIHIEEVLKPVTFRDGINIITTHKSKAEIEYWNKIKQEIQNLNQ